MKVFIIASYNVNHPIQDILQHVGGNATELIIFGHVSYDKEFDRTFFNSWFSSKAYYGTDMYHKNYIGYGLDGTYKERLNQAMTISDIILVLLSCSQKALDHRIMSDRNELTMPQYTPLDRKLGYLSITEDEELYHVLSFAEKYSHKLKSYNIVSDDSSDPIFTEIQSPSIVYDEFMKKYINAIIPIIKNNQKAERERLDKINGVKAKIYYGDDATRAKREEFERWREEERQRWIEEDAKKRERNGGRLTRELKK